MANVPPRIEKLPLAARKNIKDNFESKQEALQNKIAQYTGAPSYEVIVDFNQVYAYATEPRSYPQNSPGQAIYEYFDKFTNQLKTFTKEGTDTEATDALKKVAPKNVVRFLAGGEDVKYVRCEVVDGEIQIQFEPGKLGSNISDTGKDIGVQVDKAILKGDLGLPIATQRAIAKTLDPTIEKLQKKLQQMFGKPVPISYNALETLRLLRSPEVEALLDKDYKRDGILEARVPEWTSQYFEAVVSKMERDNWGKDEMMQEAFLDAAGEKGLTFEIVDKLQHGNYNDCIFEDGFCKLQTTPKGFGTNINEIAKDLTNRL